MKMKIEVDENELSTLLDGLGALPLARGYNLFNRLIQQGQGEGLIKVTPPADGSVPSFGLVATPEGDKGPVQ